MAAQDYIYRATRDVIGGAFGGLTSGLALAGGNRVAVTVMAVIFIIVLSATYVYFDYMRKHEENWRDGSEEQDNEENNRRWELGQAS